MCDNQGFNLAVGVHARQIIPPLSFITLSTYAEHTFDFDILLKLQISQLQLADFWFAEPAKRAELFKCVSHYLSV